MAVAFVMSVSNVQAESPPWGGDGHYTFDDDDPWFAHGSIIENASVDIVGGSFGALHSFDYSTVRMSGGVGDIIWGYESSTISIYGGSLNTLAGYDNTDITLFVESYTVELDPFLGYDARLTGSWLNDGGTFDILVRQDSMPHIHLVPEPTTMMFFGLGGLLLRRIRR
jgi:hypothetical protein